MLKDKPEMVKMTMCDQLWDSYGPFGESRIEFLDTAFKSILNYVLPDDLKLTIFLDQATKGFETAELLEYAKMPKYQKGRLSGSNSKFS